MGLLDNLYFGHNNPNGGGPGGGLLDFLRTSQMQQQNYQPSAGFPDQASPLDIGGYQMPRIGPQAAFTPDQSAIPQNAQPTQGQMPQAPQQPQGPGFGDRLMAGFQNFANAGGPLQALAGGITGLATGTTPGNQTVRFLESKGMDPAMAKTVVADPVLLRSILPQIMGTGGQTDDIKEYQFAKWEDPSLTFNKFMSQKKAVSGEYGLNYVYGTDKDGKTVAFAPGKSGEPKQIKFPEGINIARGIEKIDTGTQVVIRDKQSGAVLGYEKKDLVGKERAEAVGKGLGAADVDLASIRSKMPGLETVVKKLDDLSGKATYTIAGKTVDFANRQAGLEPREAAIARAEYTSMVDNQILPLLRDTFGAAFTQKEGDTLRATLGNPDMSPKEKQAILKSFIEQKRRDIEALETRTGSPSAPKTPVPQPSGGAAVDALLKKYGG